MTDGSTTAGAQPPAPQFLRSAQINIMAVACAFAIAALYYNQPLLHVIGVTFGSSDYATSHIVMLGQLGYALGLFLFVPIGDRVDRRALIVFLLAINTVCLAACAAAPNFTLFASATFVAGLTTITPQIIIPTVAGLATPASRGRTVGILLSGMSAGLLLGRTLSGFVSDLAGWRAVFLLAMIFNVLLMAVIWRLLPHTPATTSLSYRRLLQSLWTLFWTQPVLRAACATSFLAFAAFSALWATLAALLAEPPYRFGAGIVGSFGLVGAVTILTVPTVGRLTDKLGTRVMAGAGFAGLVLAFVFVSQTGIALWTLAVGICLIDIGYRCVLIANQTRIYPLQADSHSRLNALLMTSAFLGGATGSVCGAAAAVWSWDGVALAGGGLATLGLVFHILVSRHPRAPGS